MATSGMLQSQLLFLLQQQFIEQLSADGGTSLSEALLQRRQKTGREISAEALTGRIRSDAGRLRQASRNVSEGAAIASLAEEGVRSLVDSMKKMRDVVSDAISAGTPVSSASWSAYADLASNAESTIKGASYNGIRLLDGSGWGGDERVDPTGSISLSAGGGTRALTLTDFSTLFAPSSPGSIAPTLPTNASDLTALESTLSTQIKNLELHERGYASLASRMASEAKSFDRQALIFDTTAARSLAGAGPNSSTSLLYYLLNDQGKLINSKS